MHIDTSKKHCKSSTLEKSLLPYITANSITGHATQVQNTTLYSDGTTHSKHHSSKWVPPNASPARTITVALDMSKVFDTINIHTLIRKLLQTNISDTSIEIANYVKGCKANTTYRNHTSSQRQFKLVFHKGVSFHQHYSTYTLQTYNHQEHQFRSWDTQMLYHHIYMHKCSQKYIQPYLHKVFVRTKQSHTKSRQNNLHSIHSRPWRI